MPTTLARAWLIWLALFASACGSTPHSRIVGKWEADAAMKLTAEFRKDGTARLTIFGQTLQGTYKLSADELEWTLNGKTTKAKVNVTDTELELTNEAQQTVKYKRK